MSMWGHVREYKVPEEASRVCNSRPLELQSVVGQRMQVMGTKLSSSLRTKGFSSPRIALLYVGMMGNSKASLCCNSDGCPSKYQK